MGQYYITAVKKQGNVRWKKFCNDGGVKLMEHSYIGNDFCNAICAMLYKTPSYVVWCGDYYDSESEDCKHTPSYSSDKKGYNKKNIWGRNARDTHVSDETFQVKGKYLINLDTKEYIDFTEYCEAASIGQFDNDGWAVHPLPLLTANSNGQGGGDYYHEYPNYDMCGMWSDCLLVIDDTVPDGFTKRSDIFFAEMCHAQ